MKTINASKDNIPTEWTIFSYLAGTRLRNRSSGMINMILPPSSAGMGSRLVNPRATEMVPMNESTLTAGKLTGEDSALASLLFAAW